jgi:hypothetical protein
MSRPIKKPSLNAATSATAGESHQSSGHNSLAIVVHAANLDTGSDTLDVQMEVSADRTNWAPIEDEDGQVLAVTASDFVDTDGNGTYVAYEFKHGIPAPWIRLRITSFTDSADSDLEVSGFVLGCNNISGRGLSFD